MCIIQPILGPLYVMFSSVDGSLFLSRDETFLLLSHKLVKDKEGGVEHENNKRTKARRIGVFIIFNSEDKEKRRLRVRPKKKAAEMRSKRE